MSFKESLLDLIAAWKQSPFPSIKMTAYFPVYTELFSPYRNSSCTFIETGVLNGGSLFMWRKWLGKNARIIGIDLNPAAKRWQDHGFEILIGDQADPKFWDKAFREIGKFDVLLDDGGHQSFQQIVTVQSAIKATESGSLVVVEDTAASFMKDFASHGEHSFLQYAKEASDLLTGRSFGMYPPGRFPKEVNTEAIEEFKNVFSIQFYNGIVAFKVNKHLCPKSRVVRNQQAEAPASDFRYEGLSKADVSWPSLLEKKLVTVQGGLT